MGLVKTRRLAAMQKQQRAKAKMQAQKKSFAAKPRDPALPPGLLRFDSSRK